jgi:outer membrane protein
LPADVLRVRVAGANARQQAIQANSEGVARRATILAQIGIPPDAAVEFSEPAALLEGEGTQAAPAEHAESRRPELAESRASARAADDDAQARLYALLPSVDVVAAHVHTTGLTLSPPDQSYVGIRASWNFWEWGAGYSSWRAAQAAAETQGDEVESVRRQIGAEVVIRRTQLDAATNAVNVAREAIASAEEAYRVTSHQSRVGTATTTDLLDALAALTQARLNLARASYERAVAQVALAHALGE